MAWGGQDSSVPGLCRGLGGFLRGVCSTRVLQHQGNAPLAGLRGHPAQGPSRRERAGKPLSLPLPKPGAVWAFGQVCKSVG